MVHADRMNIHCRLCSSARPEIDHVPRRRSSADWTYTEIFRGLDPEITGRFGHRARIELHTLFDRIPMSLLAVPMEDLPFRYDSRMFDLCVLPAAW
jgi:hypothetical protein